MSAVIEIESSIPQIAEIKRRSQLDAVPSVNLLENVRAAMGGGRSLTSLVREVVALCRGPGRLLPAEFFYYRLWDTTLPLAEKRCFAGKLAQATMHHRCNDTAWLAVARDKLLTEAVVRAAGLPMSWTKAVSHPHRTMDGVTSLRGAKDVSHYLRSAANYPLFGKPIDGMYSLGAFHALKDDAASNCVVMADGATINTNALASQVASHPAGYLLQTSLAPHPAMAAVTGKRLCSARLLMLLTQEGPRIASAVIKIPAGTNVADNYWRPGNLVGAIDAENGRIGRVVSGTGLGLREVLQHPDTGVGLTDQIIPAWNETVHLARRAAVLLPGIRTQSWDIAITAGGPTILEVNWGGDLNLHQLAHGRGVIDGAFAEHLKACASGTRACVENTASC